MTVRQASDRHAVNSTRVKLVMTLNPRQSHVLLQNAQSTCQRKFRVTSRLWLIGTKLLIAMADCHWLPVTACTTLSLRKKTETVLLVYVTCDELTVWWDDNIVFCIDRTNTSTDSGNDAFTSATFQHFDNTFLCSVKPWASVHPYILGPSFHVTVLSCSFEKKYGYSGEIGDPDLTTSSCTQYCESKARKNTHFYVAVLSEYTNHLHTLYKCMLNDRNIKHNRNKKQKYQQPNKSINA